MFSPLFPDLHCDSESTAHLQRSDDEMAGVDYDQWLRNAQRPAEQRSNDAFMTGLPERPQQQQPAVPQAAPAKDKKKHKHKNPRDSAKADAPVAVSTADPERARKQKIIDDFK